MERAAEIEMERGSGEGAKPPAWMPVNQAQGAHAGR